MSGSVGMNDQEWSGKSTLVGITRASYQNIFDMSKKFEYRSSSQAVEKHSGSDRVLVDFKVELIVIRAAI